MTETEKRILQLLTAALEGGTYTITDDWEQIFRILTDHAIHALPYNLLRHSDALSRAEQMQYKMMIYRESAYFTNLLLMQTEMLEVLKDIPVVILKGSAAAMYYPYPELRTMGDIDIIVKPEQFELAARRLKERFPLTQDTDDNPRHLGFSIEGKVLVELHKYFSTTEDYVRNDELDQIVFRGIDRAQSHEIKGQRFPTLPTVENGLVLLQHIKQHLKGSGLGLRQIIDFRQFAVMNRASVNDLLELADRVRLRILGEAVLEICNRYLGAELTYQSKYPDRTGQTCEQLCEIILTNGNFGMADVSDEKRAEDVLRILHKPCKVFIQLQKYGMAHWRAAETHRSLKSFAWLYQLFYYIIKFFSGGGIRTVTEGSRRLETKNALWKALGIQ